MVQSYFSDVVGRSKIISRSFSCLIIVPKVAGSVSHSIAILLTIFRLAYRVLTRHFWWEDVWAALALIADGSLSFIRCLVQ